MLSLHQTRKPGREENWLVALWIILISSHLNISDLSHWTASTEPYFFQHIFLKFLTTVSLPPRVTLIFSAAPNCCQALDRWKGSTVTHQTKRKKVYSTNKPSRKDIKQAKHEVHGALFFFVVFLLWLWHDLIASTGNTSTGSVVPIIRLIIHVLTLTFGSDQTKKVIRAGGGNVAFLHGCAVFLTIIHEEPINPEVNPLLLWLRGVSWFDFDTLQGYTLYGSW